ncbi:hydrolase [Spiroplasma gladiatoris]|uniref:Hydrolase n=1 Tax=Spiroplasma gladiatoris TaxID=2143 RepID=A0A4P7AIE8_9MOLU|nr:alpha/beta hydrolase [Spiroplasma gladiatoris]QBQ07518.1 hydrolase [Spiroplasma gladiatoris]
MKNTNIKFKDKKIQKSWKYLKKYTYQPYKVIIMVIFFPIVLLLSFLCSKIFISYLFKYKKSGISKEGYQLNSWEQIEYDIKARKLKDFAIQKDNVEELDLGDEEKKISALIVKRKDNNFKKWVIGLHGFKRNKYSGLRSCNFFYEKGYNILTFDAYAHGNTYGVKSDFGLTNAKILDQMISWIKQKFKAVEIGILGVSMGATTSLYYAKEYYKKNPVSWMIADCPFSSAIPQIRFFLKRYLKIPWYFMSLGIKRNFLRYSKSDIAKVSLFDKYERVKKLPILYIHGLKDEFIPYHCSVVMHHLKNNQDEDKNSQLVLFEKSKHSACYQDHQTEYKNKVYNFIETKNKF